MGQIGKIASVDPKLAIDTVGDWRTIMEETGDEHLRLISLASRHVWMWMNARARREKLQRGYLVPIPSAGAKPQWVFKTDGVPPADARYGYLWEGVSSQPLTDLWPDLSGRIGGRRTKNEDLAGIFQGQVLSWLKNTTNCICLFVGNLGSQQAVENKRLPQWFVADEWNDEQPAKTGYYQSSPLSTTAQRLSPEEAGETRTPMPVSRTWACRSCTLMFRSEDDRNKHEQDRHSAPEESPVISAQSETSEANAGDDGIFVEDMEMMIRCQLCSAEFDSQGKINSHLRNVHPYEAISMWAYTCSEPDCIFGTNETRWLTRHYQTAVPRGHGFSKAATRALVQAAEVRRSKAAQKEIAAAAKSARPVVEAAPIVPDVPAAPAGSLSAAILALETENARLRQENQQLRETMSQASVLPEVTALADKMMSLLSGKQN